MLTVAKTHQHFLFDRHLEPALTVNPGDEVVFQTLDACCGEVRSVEQFLQRRSTTRPSNPLNGPVFVTGAEPGDTLLVEILHIELDEDGFQLIGPDRAMIKNEIETWTCCAFEVKENQVCFPNGIEIPVAPVIGSFGNAPEGIPTNHPNRLGGNQDVPAVCVGAKLYIPVEVPGALFSLGDVHACQGDGEVVGAPEIGAKVTVRLELVKRHHSEWYMIEDSTHWHTACAAATEAEAARLAVLQNADFISRTHRIELKDALILLTLIGQLSISRTGKWGDHEPVVCSSFSKEQLEKALMNYRNA
jgi:amidase